ncbi:MAG: MFS transporter [Clostridia bacterium]|nr:MFS transporter [Clostridia bacterium]
MDKYKCSRILYIIEATIEYFISIAVGTVYLAKLTASIGISDSITGILTSFVSLGCGFQLISIFLSHKKPVKPWVTILHIISQMFFACLYFVPIFHFSRLAKTIIFVLILLMAHIIHNIINSPKTNWFMSLVDDHKRGRFTASKEITSLIGGMLFSYFMSWMIEHFESKGDTRTAFILGGITLITLMVLHSFTLIFSKEKLEKTDEAKPILLEIKSLFKNKTLLKIILVPVLWNVASCSLLPFMGTYQTKELGFTTTFASLIIIIGSLVRVLSSRPMGKFADKFSFSNMLLICFGCEIAAFLIAMFISPSNGQVLYTLYYIFYMVGMAGINSSLINLIYDYVDISQRTSALALMQTLSGTAGFLTTLAMSILVSKIQENSNIVFGTTIYAQQILALIGLLIVIVLIIYMITVIKKIKTPKNKS